MPNYYLRIIASILLILIATGLVAFLHQFLSYISVASTINTPIGIKISDIAIMVGIGILIIHLISGSIKSYMRAKESTGEEAIVRSIKIIGYIVLVLVLSGFFGINLSGALVGAGFLGIVIGLAAQTTLSNFFSGITMNIARQFNKGDRITFVVSNYSVWSPSYYHDAWMPGFTGKIEEVGLMYSRLRGDDGLPYFVPNSILNTAAVISYSKVKEKSLSVTVELSLDKSFSQFDRLFKDQVGRRKTLGNSFTNGNVTSSISYIGATSYGVELKGTVLEEKEDAARKALMKAALEAISKIK